MSVSARMNILSRGALAGAACADPAGKQRMNRFGDAPLFLVGPRACGKTTLARELAARLGWSSTDTDQWLLERTGSSVADLVSAEGWEGFRRREAEALRAVARTRTVVATGGGMVLLPENRAFMRKSGPVLYLEAPAAVLCERLRAAPETEQRPSLTGRGLLEEVDAILRERAPLYRQTAHHIVRADQPLSSLVEAAARFLELA